MESTTKRPAKTMASAPKLPNFGSIKRLKPRKLHNFFTDLEVTSDSVVAKVRIVTNDATRRIVVDWGDLDSDILTIRPGINIDLSPVFGEPNPITRWYV